MGLIYVCKCLLFSKLFIFRVQITEDGKRALLTLAKGDMRKVLNVLQSTVMAFDKVNEDNVYTCVGYPLRQDIEQILKALLSGNSVEDSFKSICLRNIKISVE